ncbi:TonB-dependent receptor plug domain-containing protein [Vibrio astriarenae]|uniref:TonB-dependent receptor plug domain-containing protein n=1 Tax=Vibrio astriarenae TaxID=1481923 RepID=UPI003734E896
MRPSKICSFIAIALISQASYANQSPDDIMVITGTRTERSLLDTPVRTEVITSEQIDKMHAKDLTEALSNIPGLTLRSIHGKTGTEVSMQGYDGERVLILIDGMPISPSTGSRVDLDQVGVVNIKQIEIVRGAVSALYGSEAMGGVINVITTTPDTPFGIKVTADGGSYGDRDASDRFSNDGHFSLITHGATDDFYVQFAADHRDLGGSKIDADSPTFSNERGTKTNLSLTAGYKFDNGGHLRVTPSYYSSDVDTSYSEFEPGVGDVLKGNEEQATRTNLNINYNGPINDNFYLTAYAISERYSDETQVRNLSNNATSKHRESQVDFNKAEAQVDFHIGDNHLITAGLVGYSGSLEQTKDGVSDLDPTNPTQDNVEFYLQDDFYLTDEIELLPGFRAQYDSDFGGHFAPKVNLMYRPTALDEYKVRVRAGAGTGYRVPDLKERYFVFDHSEVGYMVLGNPDLEPETSTSFQVGVDAVFNQYLSGDINVYRNDTKNLITSDYVGEEAGLAIYQYENMDKSFSQGVDLMMNVARTNGWSGYAGYSYLNAEDKTTGNKLVKLPDHQFKFNINYHWSLINTEFSLFGRYETESYADSDNLMESPSHSVFDFKVNSWITDQFKVFGGVDNLADTIQDSLSSGNDYRPSTGRFVYLGMTYEY